MNKWQILTFFLCIALHHSFAQAYTTQSIEHEGVTRTYQIYVPSSYDGSTAVPLIFSFHGGNGTIADQIAIGDFSNLAETDNFIAVYPQALPDPNDDGSANWLHKDPSTIDDVLFVDALLDDLAANYQIDQNRIYACGYSLGGEFTFELGCRLNHRIAAIGVVARTMQKFTYDHCAPVHPTGVITVLGTDDFVSNYDGIWSLGVQYYVSAMDTHSFWAAHNDCNENAAVTNVPNTNGFDGTTVERHTWSTADACAYVEELKVIGGGHDWPGSFGNMDINATEEIWQFVSRYDLTGLIDCALTSTTEMAEQEQFYRVHPNPFEQAVTLTPALREDTAFQLFTSTGQLVSTGVLSPNQTITAWADLPPNLYVLRLGQQSIKLVKTE
ncbi:MAG: PHB depolymerase family esterase [Bacteroidota bacterium]